MVEGEQQGPVLVGTFFNGLRLGIWLKMEDPQVRVIRQKTEDAQVRVCPPENEGSANARSPARKWRIPR